MGGVAHTWPCCDLPVVVYQSKDSIGILHSSMLTNSSDVRCTSCHAGSLSMPCCFSTAAWPLPVCAAIHLVCLIRLQSIPSATALSGMRAKQFLQWAQFCSPEGIGTNNTIFVLPISL